MQKTQATFETRSLFDLAGWLAMHGDEILDTMHPIPLEQSRRYYISSRRRIQFWLNCTRADAVADKCDAAESAIVSEIVTRVWTALTRGIATKSDGMALVVFEQICQDHAAVNERARYSVELDAPSHKLRSLRRQCEQSTDYLLAFLPSECYAGIYAHDRVRFEKRQAEIDYERESGQLEAARCFTRQTLHAKFEWSHLGDRRIQCRQAPYHRQVISSMISMMDPDAMPIPETWARFYAPHKTASAAEVVVWN
ncbi:MAG: hypothetical protein ACJZ8O_11375 [Pirellulaceae bacterium]